MRGTTSELPFQPGEASWASFHCGGGVHSDESQGTVHSAVRTAEQQFRVGAVVVSYAGTETSILDKPVNPDVRVFYTKRARMPA